MADQAEQKRPKRRFTDEFKEGAVRLVLIEGRTINGAANDLGIHQASLSRWVEQSRADQGKSKRGTLTTDEKEELSRLRKEVRELRLEREILKKAAAFFAKENA